MRGILWAKSDGVVSTGIGLSDLVTMELLTCFALALGKSLGILPFELLLIGRL